MFHDQNRHQQHGYDAVDAAEQQAGEGVEWQRGETQKCGVDKREADSHGDVDGQSDWKRERLARADNQGSSSLYDIHMDAAQPAWKQENQLGVSVHFLSFYPDLLILTVFINKFAFFHQ